MTRRPIVFRTSHRVQFSELDPYNHVGTGQFATYFVDHRMQGLHEHIGWGVAKLAALPFAMWVRRLEIDFIKPVLPDREITITSQVSEFKGTDVVVECSMADAAGKVLSRAVMTVACVDKATNRAMSWPADAVALFYEAGPS